MQAEGENEVQRVEAATSEKHSEGRTKLVADQDGKQYSTPATLAVRRETLNTTCTHQGIHIHAASERVVQHIVGQIEVPGLCGRDTSIVRVRERAANDAVDGVGVRNVLDVHRTTVGTHLPTSADTSSTNTDSTGMLSNNERRQPRYQLTCQEHQRQYILHV